MNTVRTFTLLGLLAVAALAMAGCRGGLRNPLNKCCDPCGGCTAPQSAPATQASPPVNANANANANAKPADAGSSCGGGSGSCGGGGKSCG